MIFNFLKHGAVQTVNVQVGSDKFVKREIYCPNHGWFDLVMAGGEEAWNVRHAHCNLQPAATPLIGQALEVAV